jgi:N-acetylmuramoyl-L-alanine amidase
MANALHPDVIVSIHADGGPPEGRGFHVNYSDPPLNDAQAGPVIRFVQTMRDQLIVARACSRQPIAAATGSTGAPTWPA